VVKIDRLAGGHFEFGQRASAIGNFQLPDFTLPD